MPRAARAGSIDMTTLAVVVVVAAVVSVVIGIHARDSRPSAGFSIADNDWYLRSARNALVDARRLALDLERINGTAVLDDDDLQSLTGRIEVFASQIAQLTCLAPTAMDGRVSRSVSVSALSVGDALRDQHESRADPEGSAPRSAGAFIQRRIEFSLAIRDLANHVELL